MTWVLFWRAVNVGGNNRLPMAELRAVAEAAGARSPRTHVQSGNLVCGWEGPVDRLVADLVDAVEARFGFRTPIVARPVDRLRVLLAADPFPDAPDHRWWIGFLAGPPAPGALDALARWRAPDDRLHLDGADLTLHLPEGVGPSRLTTDRLDRAFGSPITLRNRATVRAVVELAG